MFYNQFYPNSAVCEDNYYDKKRKHKHHKHHCCAEGPEEYKHDECFTCRPTSPPGPFGIAPGNNIFFILLIVALIFCVRRRFPVAC